MVDGEPLTVSAYLSIREQLANPTKEKVFWVGVATLALRMDLRSTGKQLPDSAPFDIALYAMGVAETDKAARSYFGNPLPPVPEARKRLDQLISRHVVQRNPQVLAHL